MTTFARIVLCLGLAALPLAGSGCSRGDKHVNPRMAEAGEPVDPSADKEDALRRVVRRQLEVAARESDEDRNAVQRVNPYWYKTYSEYPDGSDTFTVHMQETESRTTPYKAQVTISKIRFATKFHNKRGDAQQDDDFFRHTGTETLAFEFRNSRWVLLGSTFVAELSEQRVDGVWTKREAVEQPVFEDEANEGWFKRVWGGITGR